MIVGDLCKPGWFVEVYPTKGIMDTFCRGEVVRMTEHWVWVKFPGSQPAGRPFRRDTGMPVYVQHTIFPCFAIRKLTEQV